MKRRFRPLHREQQASDRVSVAVLGDGRMYSDPFGQKPDRPGPARLPNGSRRSARPPDRSPRRSAQPARRFRSYLGCRLKGSGLNGLRTDVLRAPRGSHASAGVDARFGQGTRCYGQGPGMDGRMYSAVPVSVPADRSAIGPAPAKERRSAPAGRLFLFEFFHCYKWLSSAGTASVREAREPWGQLARAPWRLVRDRLGL